jgi:hypothetical protein
MAKSTELAVKDVAGVPALGIDMASEVFLGLSKSSEYLERLQLYTKGKAIDQGLIGPGRYGVPHSDDNIEDLGTEIDILPLCCRPKALDMRDKDAIVTNYDPTSEQFREIETTGKTANSGCMFGLTFLIFERSTGKFYELFCGTKSMRNECGKIGAFLPMSEATAEALETKTGKPCKAHGPLPCTLKAKYVTKGDWGWHVPVCSGCSEPFSNLPPIEALKTEIENFMALKNTEIEKVEETTTKKRAR